jgi:hypothetical protein
MEIHEENIFLSSKIVLFQADQQKRSRTVGPGSYMDDQRSRLNSGIDHVTTAEDPARGRRARRESANLEAFRNRSFAAPNVPDEVGHAGPSNTGLLSGGPHTGHDTNEVQWSSDPALSTTRPLAPSPVGEIWYNPVCMCTY